MRVYSAVAIALMLSTAAHQRAGASREGRGEEGGRAGRQQAGMAPLPR